MLFNWDVREPLVISFGNFSWLRNLVSGETVLVKVKVRNQIIYTFGARHSNMLFHKVLQCSHVLLHVVFISWFWALSQIFHCKQVCWLNVVNTVQLTASGIPSQFVKNNTCYFKKENEANSLNICTLLATPHFWSKTQGSISCHNMTAI